MQDIEFAIEDALEWTDRDIRADAPPNSLQIIDRIFAIYIVRTIWDERSDIPVLAYRSVCDGALNLSQSLLRDDDGMQEVATHQALLELEPICPKLDYAQHKRVVNLMTTL
ncbi:MAG: hypothetical protein IPN84_04715 [Sphingomonadales bacterium]|nr:hypothetical protein [Sphingomonadales bacterium]